MWQSQSYSLIPKLTTHFRRSGRARVGAAALSFAAATLVTAVLVDGPAAAASLPSIPGFTKIDTITVPTDGSSLRSSVILASGTTYKLRASGTFTIGCGGESVADAEYAVCSVGTINNCTVFPQTDLGIGINSVDIDADTKRPASWGPFAADHVYVIDFVGKDRKIKANYHDCNYADNSGSLTVEVYEPTTCGAAALAPAAGTCEEAKVGTTDGKRAIDGGDAAVPSVLELKSLPADFPCGLIQSETPECTYEWFRSGGQSDAAYAATADTASPSNEQHNLGDNGTDDVGHRFFLQITGASDNVVRSNAVAVGPSAIPELVYPISSEQVRVRLPFLNVKNVAHDQHSPENPEGTYTYDFEVSADNTFPTGTPFSASGDERATNNGISFAQISDVLANGTWFWRARAVMAGAPGRWSDPQQFAVSGVWSANGEVWHLPFVDPKRVTGTFGEGYFHSGTFGGGRNMHLGTDFADCSTPVLAARSGRLRPRTTGALPLLHPDINRKTIYRHMTDRTALPDGTYVNQGTQLGLEGNVGTLQCHLHFDVTSDEADPVTYFNPLNVLPASQWINTDDPKVASIRFRSVESSNTALMNSGGGKTVKKTDIRNSVYVIAGTNDPNGTARLAPERVEFRINGTLEHTIDFSSALTATAFERDFYAMNTFLTSYAGSAAAAARIPPSSGNSVYFLYYKWDTSTLAADGGPVQIEIKVQNHAGATDTKNLRIGPAIAGPVPNICGGGAHNVNITVQNRNNGLEALTGSFAGDGDVYGVIADGHDVAASVGGATLAVAGGGSGVVHLHVNALPAGTNHASVTLRVRSGILTDVSDRIQIQVNRTC